MPCGERTKLPRTGPKARVFGNGPPRTVIERINFRRCRSAKELRSERLPRHEPLQLLIPVLNDHDIGRRGLLIWTLSLFDHQEPTAIQ